MGDGVSRGRVGFGAILLLGTLWAGLTSPVRASELEESQSDSGIWNMHVRYEMNDLMSYFYADFAIVGHTPMADNEFSLNFHLNNDELLKVLLRSRVIPKSCDSSGCVPGDTSWKQASFWTTDPEAVAGGRADGGRCFNDYTPQCVIPFNWVIERDYRIILRGEPESDTSGRIRWTISIYDLTTERRTQIGTLTLPTEEGLLDGTVYGLATGYQSCDDAPYTEVWFGQATDSSNSGVPGSFESECAASTRESRCADHGCYLSMNPTKAFGFSGAKVVGLDESGEPQNGCTLGFAARKDVDGEGQEFWVTADHCTHGLGWSARSFHLMHAHGPFLGGDSYGVRDRRHDSFAIPTREVLGTNRIHIPKPDGTERMMRITSVGEIGARGDRVGDSVCIVGAQSGVQKCGKLMKKMRTPTGVTRRHAKIPMVDGDSGGPVYRHLGNGRIQLIGIHSQADGTDGSIYIHVRNIMRKLGVTPLTG